jgi:hypothetical protein
MEKARDESFVRTTRKTAEDDDDGTRRIGTGRQTDTNPALSFPALRGTGPLGRMIDAKHLHYLCSLSAVVGENS